MTHIAGYIQALLFAALFLVFINADIGWAFIYIIAGTAVISSVLLFASKKHFSVSLRELSGTAAVGEEIEYGVTLEKTGFCFIPYIEIELSSADKTARIRTSLLFDRETFIRGTFRAAHSGLNKLRLTEVRIRDFAGIFSLKVPITGEAKKAVLPRIIDYKGPEVIPTALPSEDEDPEEGASVVKGGLPGYEHREYVPGDSPKRVNYKLSAKRNKLMVRLDESTGCASTNLFITENGLPICSELAFALANQLVIRGGTVMITHKNESRSASTPETLSKMREWLAFREYAEVGGQFSESLPPKDTDVVFSGSGEIGVRS